jgi:AcrR family transcriptional regulator
MAAAEIDEAAGTRQRILTAAYTLFYRHGFVRVALEAIAAQAGVTKRTLYYHFRSKDDLLAAALELHSGLALARIREWGAGLPAEPAAMVEALFAELARWASGPHFEGAGYTRLVMELADLPGHPARAVANRHKATVEAWLAGELAARAVAAPSEAARCIQLLLEGAMVMMLIHADARYAREAAEMAKAAVATPSSAP